MVACGVERVGEREEEEAAAVVVVVDHMEDVEDSAVIPCTPEEDEAEPAIAFSKMSKSKDAKQATKQRQARLREEQQAAAETYRPKSAVPRALSTQPTSLPHVDCIKHSAVDAFAVSRLVGVTPEALQQATDRALQRVERNAVSASSLRAWLAPKAVPRSLPATFTASTAPLAKLTGIKLELTQPHALRQRAVMKVTQGALMRKNMPNPNSASDLRLGARNRHLPCKTCGETQNCHGHHGVNDMEYPCFNPLFEVPILKVARSVCYRCSRILLSRRDPRMRLVERAPPELRLTLLAKFGKTISYCGYCPLAPFDRFAPPPLDPAADPEVHLRQIRERGCGFKQPIYPSLSTMKDRLRFHCFYDPTDALPDTEEETTTDHSEVLDASAASATDFDSQTDDTDGGDDSATDADADADDDATARRRRKAKGGRAAKASKKKGKGGKRGKAAVKGTGAKRRRVRITDSDDEEGYGVGGRSGRSEAGSGDDSDGGGMGSDVENEDFGFQQEEDEAVEAVPDDDVEMGEEAEEEADPDATVETEDLELLDDPDEGGDRAMAADEGEGEGEEEEEDEEDEEGEGEGSSHRTDLEEDEDGNASGSEPSQSGLDEEDDEDGEGEGETSSDEADPSWKSAHSRHPALSSSSRGTVGRKRARSPSPAPEIPPLPAEESLTADVDVTATAAAIGGAVAGSASVPVGEAAPPRRGRMPKMMPPKDTSNMTTEMPRFSNKVLYDILRAVHPEDKELMGLKSDPCDMFIRTLYVPPTPLNATGSFDGSGKTRSESDLIRAINNIIKLNLSLRKEKADFLQRVPVHERAALSYVPMEIEAAKISSRAALHHPGLSAAADEAETEDSSTNVDRDQQQQQQQQQQHNKHSASSNGASAKPRPSVSVRQHQEDEHEVSQGAEALGVDELYHPCDDDDFDFGAINHSKITPLLTKLQFEVIALITNNFPKGSIPASLQAKAANRMGMVQKMKGKHAWVRKVMGGKRCNSTARAIITPNPSLDVDQIGCPMAVAQTLSRMVRVTRRNLKDMVKLVRSTLYPQAVALHRPDGRMLDLNHCDRSTAVVRVGWMVERNLMNGDRVIMNRQPSLHRLNVLGFRIWVHKWKTFMLNPSVAPPFAADFDGDEMSMHSPTTEGADRETGSLVGAIHHQTTPQSGRPMMGVILDALVAAYKLSSQEVFLTREQYTHLVGMAKFWNRGVIAEPAVCAFDPDSGEWIERWTGKQLFSEICPDIDHHQLSFTNASLQQQPEMYLTFNNAREVLPLSPRQLKTRADMVREILMDRQVILLHGDLLCGRLDASCLANQMNSFGHVILDKHGVVANARFTSDVQRVGNEYLTFHVGLSIGVMDAGIPIGERIHARVEAFVQFLNEHPDLQISDQNSPALNAAIEAKLCSLVSELRNHIGGLIREYHLSPDNPIENRNLVVIAAGSKAKITHLAQSSGTFGQTLIGGERSKPRFKDRTWSYFKPGERTLQSLGLIRNSFIRGLNLPEMLFQAEDARQGVVNTGQFLFLLTLRRARSHTSFVLSSLQRTFFGRFNERPPTLDGSNK
jgi:DNA-directed RNA polymerase beta' subunit